MLLRTLLILVPLVFYAGSAASTERNGTITEIRLGQEPQNNITNFDIVITDNITTSFTNQSDVETFKDVGNVETTELSTNGTDLEDLETRSEIESIFHGVYTYNETGGEIDGGVTEGVGEGGEVTEGNGGEETKGNVGEEPKLGEMKERAQEEGGGGEGGVFGSGERAAILTGAFIVIAIAGYLGFVFWRKFLEKRYGNSEMLITDDVYDISDLRNFEI